MVAKDRKQGRCMSRPRQGQGVCAEQPSVATFRTSAAARLISVRERGAAASVPFLRFLGAGRVNVLVWRAESVHGKCISSRSKIGWVGLGWAGLGWRLLSAQSRKECASWNVLFLPIARHGC